ncbi:MAG: molybdenum cofactor biosynthesis protein MoaE [Acidilobaceae archaeon]|nr:molybdenum cofactor biosynthesis protein MoaE [Acidilobaceae archaeon]
MKVRVKLYSLFRDAMGSSELLIALPDGSSVGDLLEALMKDERFERAYRTLNGSLVVLDEEGGRLEREDKVGPLVHLMPPPAGGAHVEVGVLKGSELDLAGVIGRLSKASRGAVAVFVGHVKGYNAGERVEGLYYEHSEELLERVLRRIAEEEARKWGLSGVAIYHYVGWRRVGEMTIAVAVAGGSRSEVLPALAEVVERVKHEAPIWKVEHRESGKYYILGDKVIKFEGSPSSLPTSP